MKLERTRTRSNKVVVKMGTVLKALRESMKPFYLKTTYLWKSTYQGWLDEKFGEDEVKVPDLHLKGVEFSDVPKHELDSALIEVCGDLGNREPYYFILISAEAYDSKILLTFINTMTKWPVARLVYLDLKGEKVLYNGFREVRKLHYLDSKLKNKYN